MINLFQTRLFKKVASKFGFYYNSIRIHGVKFEDVGISDLKEYYFNKNVEIETYKFLKGSNYDTFIDIGAFFGYFSIYAKLKAGIKNVIAYEASQKNFNQLKKFAKLNGTDFEIINKAVGDKKGNVKFYSPIYKGNSSFTQHGQIDSPKTNPIYADKKSLSNRVQGSVYNTFSENVIGAAKFTVETMTKNYRVKKETYHL